MESAAHEKPGVVAVASCQHAQEVKVASAYNQPSRSVGLGRSSSWMITTSAPVYPPTDGGFVGWFQNGTDGEISVPGLLGEEILIDSYCSVKVLVRRR